ncbi:MAG: hypothetical protein ACJ760_02285 [Thermoleophilaceae bacterium]
MVGFVVFFVAGFVFGYAAPGLSAFIPVLFPLVIGLYTGLTQGFDGHIVLFTLLGIVVTLVGIVLGRMLTARLEGGEPRSST